MIKHQEILYGILAVIGGILIHITYGHFYTIGNLAPYMASYIIARVDPSFDSSSIVWISAIALAIQGFSMPLGGFLLPKIGYRAVIIIGSSINSLSVLLTYFTIQKGIVYVVITYAITLGFGFGFSYAVIFSVAASWFPERRALIVGFIVGGFGLGALIFTPIQTAYINPHNIAVNKTTRLFVDNDLLDRVPKMFLILGGALASIQLVGIILLRQKPESITKKDFDNSKSSETKGLSKNVYRTGDDGTNTVEKNANNLDPDSSNFRSSTADWAGDKGDLDQTSLAACESMHSLHVSHTNLAPSTTATERARQISQSSIAEVNYSPRMVLRRHEFYLLWLLMFCNIIPITLITASFKLVGQKYISDDKFLSAVATISSLFNSGGRIMWGAICDRLSFKFPLCAMLAIWSVALFTFPYIVNIQSGAKALYAIWVCLLYLSLSGVFVLMPAATGRLFGPNYMAVNYGLVFSAFSVGSIICGFITELLVGDYVALYSICGGVCLIGLFIVTWINDSFISPKLNWCKLCSGMCQRLQPRIPVIK